MVEEKFYICIDIGGTKILGVIFDAQNSIIDEIKIMTTPQNGSIEFEKKIFGVINDLINSNKFNGHVCAISIGIPGIIDPINGEVLFAPNLYLKKYPLRAKISDTFNIPCFIENDVNLGLLGECTYGFDWKYRNCLGVFVGTGVGGGIIINQKLYTGSSNLAGEFGHMVLDNEGPFCACGQRGCLEAYAGKTGITDYVRAQIFRGRHTSLNDSIEKYGAIKGNSFKKALNDCDEVALEVADRTSHYLARGIGILINIFNPEAIILGGGIVEASKEYFVSTIKEKLSEFSIPEILNKTTILATKLGDYSVVYGARAIIEKSLCER